MLSFLRLQVLREALADSLDVLDIQAPKLSVQFPFVNIALQSQILQVLKTAPDVAILLDVD